MSRQTWVTRDSQGKVVSRTEVRKTSGCSSCLWVALGVFVFVAPAAWAGGGQIPLAVAVVMYIAEAMIALGALAGYAKRRAAGRGGG
jgi:energy-converting hydrogenase Eha subunit G